MDHIAFVARFCGQLLSISYVTDITTIAIFGHSVATSLEIEGIVKCVACPLVKAFLVLRRISKPAPASRALCCIEVLAKVAILILALCHNIDVLIIK